MGIVVVAWETFPALAELLAKSSLGKIMGESNATGWLFVAHSDAKHVSVLFPWRDVAEFTA